MQKGEAAADLRTPPAGLKIFDRSDRMTDFAETAAAIRCLDLVMTVDTAVAHLAGALGVPVWLLNRCDTDWRWLELPWQAHPGGGWYPTLRQFRQPAPGDWGAVVREVAAALAEPSGPEAGGAVPSPWPVADPDKPPSAVSPHYTGTVTFLRSGRYTDQ